MWPLSAAGALSVWRDGVPFKIHSEVTGTDGEGIGGVQNTGADIVAGQSIGDMDHAAAKHQKHWTMRDGCVLECITKVFVVRRRHEWNHDGPEIVVMLTQQVGHGRGVQ